MAIRENLFLSSEERSFLWRQTTDAIHAYIERVKCLYAAEGAHDSIVSAARIAGLGDAAVHRVPTDQRLSVSIPGLLDGIARDRKSGATPAMIVASARATASGAIDNLDAIVEIAAAESTWFHIDGAWGAAAAHERHVPAERNAAVRILKHRQIHARSHRERAAINAFAHREIKQPANKARRSSEVCRPSNALLQPITNLQRLVIAHISITGKNGAVGQRAVAALTGSGMLK